MSEIKGIGEGAPIGWVLEEYEIPMPKGLQEILEAIKSVLQQGKVQSVALELGKPIRFTRMVKEEEAAGRRRQESEAEAKLGDIARNVLLEEYAGSGKTPTEVFFESLLHLEARRLHLTHIGVGPQTRMFDWLGIDKVAYGAIENLGGAQLVRDKGIPDDRMMFFGSPYRQGRTDQITYALALHLFLPGEDLQEVRA